jgi:glycosyltransferase involved in cell wall biosynthesis
MSVPPLVSVRTLTYNHEKYIAQCLEGILMQRTNFPFEVVVGEDCSTDRTQEIVLAYEKKYPDKIRAITSERNVGAARNIVRVQQACQGKYHAFCEGDDYWIDPLKLQKQVDFMEAHPDVSLCFHNVFVVKESNYSVRLSPAKIFTHPSAKLFTHPWRAGLVDLTLGHWVWQVIAPYRV